MHPEGYGLADLHLHTRVSDGMADIPDVLRYVQDQTRLDVIAVTDHETCEGGLRARDLAKRMGYHVEVIVGAEITTRQGHVLALFLERDIPRYLSLADTLQAVHEQGGLAIAPNPMSWLTFSIGEGSLDRVAQSRQQGVFLDALETVNASPAGRVASQKVRRLNQQRYNLAETGSSDSHFLTEIGAAYTAFPGHTAEELREAIRQRQTVALHAEIRPAPVGVDALIHQQFRSLVVLPGRSLTRPLRERIREL